MRRPELTLRPARRAVALIASLAAVAGASTLAAAPAQAAGRVTVDADGKGAVIDSTYSTTLSVKGSGFQSVKGGHGGVYVWFGTVNGAWKPSAGGKSGVNYVYVPDSEEKDNAGFQRYVAFPGSNTASAANGGTMDAAGNWSTQLVVPGPKFEAVGRNGATTVDCRKVTCGIITIGAHGVRNGNNETFTPVKLADLGESQSKAPSGQQTPVAGATKDAAPKSTKASTSGPVALTVDHPAAVAGASLSFTAENLVPGEQFTVVLDQGATAVGPFAAGEDGRAAGVVALPPTLAAGTHVLRLFGSSKEGEVKFGVQAAAEDAAPVAADEQDVEPGTWFALAAVVVFLLVLGWTVLRRVRGRRDRA